MWILFHQHFSTYPEDLSLGLWKKRGILHCTDRFMAETLFCLHLNNFFSKFIPLKCHVFIDTVKQQCFIFLFFPSEIFLNGSLMRPHNFSSFISNATLKITPSTSLNLSVASSLYIIEHSEQCDIASLQTRWRKEFQLRYSSFCVYSSFTEFHRIHLQSDCQQLNYSSLYLNYPSLYGTRNNSSLYGSRNNSNLYGTRNYSSLCRNGNNSILCGNDSSRFYFCCVYPSSLLYKK